MSKVISRGRSGHSRGPRYGRAPLDQITVKGFARVQVGEVQRDGTTKIVGDSGWFKNTITIDGRNSYLAARVGGVSGSKAPAQLALATQTNAVVSTQASASGDITNVPVATNGRKALTASTIATGTLQMTASWASSELGGATTIGALQVYDVTTTGGAVSMGSAQTFATSQWNTNQNVSATYQWQF